MLRLEGGELGAHALELLAIGRSQRRMFLAQPLIALRQLRQDLERVLAAGFLKLQRLRVFRHRLLQRIALILPRPKRQVGNRQERRLTAERRLTLGGLLLRKVGRPFGRGVEPLLQVGDEMRHQGERSRALGAQLVDLRARGHDFPLQRPLGLARHLHVDQVERDADAEHGERRAR